jgi:RimJ/RimL family protein N-acetyltransferase
MAIKQLSRHFLWVISDFAFHQCGVNKVIAPIASTNEKMVRLAEHMGFIQEARIVHGCPHGDLLFYTLLERNCRFLGGKYCVEALQLSR